MGRSSALQIRGFLRKYSPAVAADVQIARRALKRLVPRGYELVYDNYNTLAFGISPTLRAGGAIVSVAAYPKWVTLFFLHGKGLQDPRGLLQGSGARVRSIRLAPVKLINSRPVQQLLRQALAPHRAELAAAPRLSPVVKSVSAKQRPRRPGSDRQTGKRVTRLAAR
jgi:hypothetical protein